MTHTASAPPLPNPGLQLDWRRALGVHLWYGCQPTATVAEALASYTVAVESGAAPAPVPLYAEQAAGGGAGASAASSSAFDVAFELLRLHAVGSDPEASGSPAALQPLLARLLRCGGVMCCGGHCFVATCTFNLTNSATPASHRPLFTCLSIMCLSVLTGPLA